MKASLTISLLLMNEKGYKVLCRIIDENKHKLINVVVAARDPNLTKDYYEEILQLCSNWGISFLDRKDIFEPDLVEDIVFTIGWRWLVKSDLKKNLIVSHDSLLPRYRGFAPLVNMLINKEKEIGVSFLTATDEFDSGDIILQKRKSIEYPITINNAIQIVSKLFSDSVIEIIEHLESGNELQSTEQDSERITYSLWRDQEDYLLDFNQSADYLQRFIDAVGSPYQGASAFIKGQKVRVLDSEAVEDFHIENRDVGKVMIVVENRPVVVCGKGMLLLKSIVDDKTRGSILPLRKFRTRFIGQSK
jgi:methionyl-tRNA formyltransferase